MRKNSEEALAVLERCGARLYGLLLRMTLRREVAQELLQELFLRLAGAEGFAKAEDREGYAFRAAIHLAMDWRRRERRERKAGVRVGPVTEDVPALVQLVRDEEVRRVLDGLEELTEPQREAFVLQYLEQLEYEEVGRRMGKTSQQARGLCSRAIQALRQRLGVRERAEVSDE